MRWSSGVLPHDKIHPPHIFSSVTSGFNFSPQLCSDLMHSHQHSADVSVQSWNKLGQVLNIGVYSPKEQKCQDWISQRSRHLPLRSLIYQIAASHYSSSSLASLGFWRCFDPMWNAHEPRSGWERTWEQLWGLCCCSSRYRRDGTTSYRTSIMNNRFILIKANLWSVNTEPIHNPGNISGLWIGSWLLW